MKKLILMIAVLFAMTMTTTAAERIIQFNELPLKAQELVNKYFSSKKINNIMMEKDLTKTEYNVQFDDNSEIEFKGNGDWEEIEIKNECLPSGIFTAAVTNFLNQEHAGYCISKAEKEWHVLKIELQNGLEIVFNSKGEFLRYND
jgi:Protein of unknown function (DUF2874).